VQEAAQRGGLGSPAARALNGGLLAAGLVHMRVLLPILASELGKGWKSGGLDADLAGLR
jgi:hypothetical protein